MSEKIKTAILISGRGSNMKALIKACQNLDFPAEIALVIANNENAAGLSFAKSQNIKTVIVNHKNFTLSEEFDKKIDEVINNNGCHLICLAGFMRLLSGWFVRKWRNRIINIHPSLLPSFKGANAVEDALNYGVKYSGCTVHFVTEDMDSGPIIEQAVVQVLENDTKQILSARILEQEHVVYKKALAKVADNLLKKHQIIK